MPRMFDLLLRQSSLQGDTPPEFLMTHPLTASRVSDTRLRAAQYPPVKKTSSHFEYEMMRVRALLHFFPNETELLKTKLQQDNISAEGMRYLEALFLARQHQPKEALQILDALAHQHEELLSLQATAAMVALQANQPEEALKRTRQLLRQAPEYTPAQLTAIQAGLRVAPTQAYQLATQLTQSRPEDAEAWQLLHRRLILLDMKVSVPKQ